MNFPTVRKHSISETDFAEFTPLPHYARIPNVMNKVSSFLKEVQAELKKVVWPTRQQALRLTGIVVGVSLVVGMYIGVLDYALTKIVEVIVK